MHTHSSGISSCAKKDVFGMIEDSISAGLDGFVLCNHYSKKESDRIGADKFDEMYTEEFRAGKKYGDLRSFRVFFGIEVTMEFCRDVHLLIYGVDDEFHARQKKPLYEMTAQELYAAVKSADGIVSQAHPMRKNNSVFIDMKYLDALELNSHLRYDGPHTDLICSLAREHGLFVTSGGDYHADTRRTYCGIFIPDDIADCKGIKDFLVSSDSYDIALEDTVPVITFTK